MASIKTEINGNLDVAMKFSKYPPKLSKQMQEALQKQGAPIVRRNIKKGIPVSKRSKVHAKNANSLTVEAIGGRRGYRNIGFYIRPKDQFWYMKFPNNGSGTSRNNTPKQFFQRGVKQSTNSIYRIVNQVVKNSTP